MTRGCRTLIAGAGEEEKARYGARCAPPGLLRVPTRSYGGDVVTCDLCGRTAEEGAVVLTWTTAVENGRRRMFCDRCSREHLRAMEGKLDSEWW